MEILDELKGTDWPFGNSPVNFDIDAGFSTRAADIDNVLKPLLDTFQSIYDDFNDNRVYDLYAKKHIVPKGKEFLCVTITEFTGITTTWSHDTLEELMTKVTSSK